MLSRIGPIALLAALAASAQTDTDARARAQRDREDQHWARTSGLSAGGVRALRLIAGIADTTSGAPILNIDADSLKRRNHILFAEAGNGHCLRLHVFERIATGFTEIWSLNELPGPSFTWNGAKYELVDDDC